MPLPQEITGGRVLLRAPVPSDADVIFESYAQDAAVTRFLLWQPHKSVGTTRAFIASCIDAWRGDTRRPYVIAERPASNAIGMIEARLHLSRVDLGYVLARQHWGKGLMAEAISALANAALALPTIFRVQAFCDIENSQSQRTLEKAGFMREGTLHRWVVHPNVAPEPRDCYMYASIR